MTGVMQTSAGSAFRYGAFGMLSGAILLAILAPPPAQARHRPHSLLTRIDDPSPPAADPQEQSLLHLGRLVALAPRCGLRDRVWAQRLDIGLLDALTALAGGGPALDEAQLLLAANELAAVHQHETQGKALCAQLRQEPDLAAELQRADQLAGGTPAPVQTPRRAPTAKPSANHTALALSKLQPPGQATR
jgi:hypothetical protein